MEKLWTEYGVLLALGALFAAVLTTCYIDGYNWGWLNIIPGHRGRMMKKARWDYVLGVASDKFASDIMDWVMDETLTQQEANELYRLVKQVLQCKSLYPSEVLLKEAIQKRIASGVLAPVGLPKEVSKRKSLFEKLPV